MRNRAMLAHAIGLLMDLHGEAVIETTRGDPEGLAMKLLMPPTEATSPRQRPAPAGTFKSRIKALRSKKFKGRNQ